MDVQHQPTYNTSYCYSASSNDHLENPFSDRFAFSSSVNNFSSPPRDSVLDSVMKERKPTTKKRSLKLSVDPQSVAARQRRQRIRKRFKILQTMVPGGSKMDTASMLDGAINYVKFLKTQIWLHQMFSNNFSGFNDLQVTSAATPNMPQMYLAR